jgi:hypothetical protein
VENLSFEASAAHVTLQNTLTRVALLAHTKFIESVRLRGGAGRGAARPSAARARASVYAAHRPRALSPLPPSA